MVCAEKTLKDRDGSRNGLVIEEDEGLAVLACLQRYADDDAAGINETLEQNLSPLCRLRNQLAQFYAGARIRRRMPDRGIRPG